MTLKKLLARAVSLSEVVNMSLAKMIIMRTLLVVVVLAFVSTEASAWPFKTDHGYARAVAVCPDGNIIAAGSLSGPTLDVYKLSGHDGSVIWHYQASYGSASDVLVDAHGDVVVGSALGGSLIKISGQNGAELWAQSLFATVNALKIDTAGNVIAAGMGGESFKIVKLDANGYLIWSYISPRGDSEGNPGLSTDFANALDLDLDGNVIAAGKISDDFAVVRILGQSGIETARMLLDGSGNFSYFFEQATGVVVDPDGDIIAVGDTCNPEQGPSDFTVVKFTGDLRTVSWLRTIDGTSHYLDYANAVAVDSAGDVIAAGSLFNFYGGTNGGPGWANDQFAVIKLSGESGEVLWTQGGNFDDEGEPVRGIAYDVVVNRGGNVVATGLYGESFMVVKKYALSGKNWWRHLEVDAGASGVGYGVALDAQNNVIAGGQTNGVGSNYFTVVKLERLSGVPYVGTPDLVTALAPIVYLHSDDRYRPGDPSSYISNCSLQWSHDGYCNDDEVASLGSVRAARLGRGGTGDTRPAPYTHNLILPLASGDSCTHNLRARFKSSNHTRPYDTDREEDSDSASSYLWSHSEYQREGFYLDLDDGDETLRNGISSVPGSPVYPGAPAFYEYEPHKYITYWFFYPYDEFSNYRGLPDFPLQAHEGDWERVSIQLDCDDDPLNIFYYHHQNGMLAAWSTIDKYQGTHPVVFSAKGSHASYPDAGAYMTDACLPTGFCFEDQTDSGPAWSTWHNLADVKAQLWYGFGGAWGEFGNGNPAVGGGDYTGPLGPSKYKTSVKTWEEEHPYPICGP